jgi:hypothetical protein
MTPVQERAHALILRLLTEGGGSIPSRVLTAELKTEDISDRAFRWARDEIGIHPRKSGMTHMWSLEPNRDEIPRKGAGWECPTCGGEGWVEHKPQFRNPRGPERVIRQARARERKRAWLAQRNGREG